MSQKKGDNQIVNESYISATGCVGLEFDNIEPLKNLIDQVTGEYHNKMLGYLEAIESLQGKLRFSSLSLTDELNQCYESINRQNRSLNNPNKGYYFSDGTERFYQRELDYLSKKGYTFKEISDGIWEVITKKG